MSSTKSTELPPTMTAPWTEPEPLADVPGGEPNLLHRSAWSDPANPLKVMLEPWYDEDPPGGPYTERVDVFLGDNESNIIGFQEWSLPMDPDDYYVPISAERLPSGTHALSFIMTNFLGTPARSHPFTVTVDKTPPVLATTSELEFPREVLPPNKLTAHYLEQNNDELKANLPGYTDPRPWDRITWYWGRSPGNQDQGGVIELDDQNYANPIVVTISADLIQDRGDGLRYVWYQVEDRAGNPSRTSASVELDVAATPIPRVLPWPSVERATGTGEQQTLDPVLFESGAVVVIPADAVIYPGEKVWVQWGEPGSVGACRTDQEISAGSRRYAVPMRSIAAYIGKRLPLSYSVTVSEDEVLPSQTRTLNVLEVDSTHFPTVQCQEAFGGQLSFRDVPSNGAQLRLDPWKLATTDQRIWISMAGNISSGPIEHFAINGSKVTQAQVDHGVRSVIVPKTFLERLTRNRPLTGKVYVSFDGGEKPIFPNFPPLNLTLVD
ncbi:hypothetical protein HGO40_18320 [Pseudomonas sp. CG7]|uniref:hypothetical protein n=1 Tax=Pseudomonas sp. CG7 TaxID=191007 RepID=UPI0020332BEE|nr:hypothetical protein [Pseudomonas sp. CG7]MCM2462407.1 hypothetical protein [Pseudomonas sp. CG7]